jgi:hypothetical protein
VLVDGFASGTWKITRDRSRATLIIAPYQRLGKQDRADLTEEGSRLLTFAASDTETHDIRFLRPAG